MTHVPHLSGAVDLSKLPSVSAVSAGSPVPRGGGDSYAIALDEQNLNEVVQQSAQVPVFLIVWSEADAASVQARDALTSAVNAAAGRTLVGTIDAQAHPQIVSALRAPGVPFVAVALSGQLQPLYAQNIPAAQVSELVQQVIDGAAQQGLQGTVAPYSSAPAASEPDAPALTPAQQAAQDLFDSGCYEDAVAAWKAVIAQSPADELAAQELRRSELLARVHAPVREGASPLETTLAAADQEFLNGDLPTAFNRLLAAFQAAEGSERETIRVRLLDLFEVAGDDPAVVQARARLAGLLF